MEIVYLKHNEINKYKWDKCISNAFNGIIYAYSWYLDIICEDWEALVQGDYKRVFPLTNGIKYNIPYLYQPFFAQQLGIISTIQLTPDIINDFLNAIPAKYKFIEINLNIFNQIENDLFSIRKKQTFELDLIKPAKIIRKEYSKNTKRNIKKAQANNINISTNNIPNNELITFYKENTGKKIADYKEKDYYLLRRIANLAIHHRFGQIYTAFTQQNTLCAAAFFLTSHNKSIYLLGASTPEGFEKKAMFLIIDKYIENHAERNLTLDFEGSNIESIARFFRGFGAEKCTYLSVKRNNLPWYIKFFKK